VFVISGNAVRGPYRFHKPGRYGLQEFVTHVMTQCVINTFEIIEVQKQYRQQPLMLFSEGYSLVEKLSEEKTVW
jgi:hypothetical protein